VLPDDRREVSSMIDSVYALLDAVPGVKLFQIKPGEKSPLRSGWQAASTDEIDDLEEAWASCPDANIGVDCEKSRLLVVDVDCSVKNGHRKVGKDSYAVIVAEHGHVETFTVRTWSGGVHYYYRVPDGAPSPSTTNRIGLDIDTRGIGGLVVAPGSVHSGGHYEIVDDRPVAEAPKWLVDELTGTAEAATARAAIVRVESADDLADVNESLEHVDWLFGRISEAPVGVGNDTIHRTAVAIGTMARYGQLGDDDGGIWSMLTEKLAAAVSGWAFDGNDSFERAKCHVTFSRGFDWGCLHGDRPYITRGVYSARTAKGGTSTPEGVGKAPEAAPEGGESGSSTPESKAKGDWGTDSGQAEWFLAETGDRHLHIPGVGFLRWDGKVWATATDDQVHADIQSFYRVQLGKALRALAKAQDDETLIARCKFLRGRRNVSGIQGTFKALRWEATPDVDNPAAMLDRDHHLLNTPDGVVDLRTGVVGPHDRGLHMTRITRGNYRPGVRSEDWETVSTCLPAEVWEYLQLRAGASIVGNSAPDSMLFLYGARGRNGKSTIVDDGIFPALGGYAHMAGAGILKGGTAAEAATPEKADLMGKRFVFIEEFEDDTRVSGNEVKRLVGTATVTARRLYKDVVTFDATHTIFVTTNTLPAIAETTDAAWRRLMMIKFENEFVQNPVRENQRKASVGLRERLHRGADGQHDAVVTWLVEGALRYHGDIASILAGREPSVVAEWTSEWRRESDRAFGYIDECLVFDDAFSVNTGDLYDDVNRWLASCGYPQWSRKVVTERITSHSAYLAPEKRPRQASSREGVSRPSAYTQAELPRRPLVLRGVRFRSRDE
jgi:P4 family phage/plasmid primase-like protien